MGGGYLPAVFLSELCWEKPRSRNPPRHFHWRHLVNGKINELVALLLPALVKNRHKEVCVWV